MKLFDCDYCSHSCRERDYFEIDDKKNVLDNVASLAIVQLPTALIFTAVAAVFFGAIFNKINLPFKKMQILKISSIGIFSISSLALTPIFSILPWFFTLNLYYAKIKHPTHLRYNIVGDTVDDEMEGRYIFGRICLIAFGIMQSISQIIALCIATFLILPKCSSYSLISKISIVAASVFFSSYLPTAIFAFAELGCYSISLGNFSCFE